MAKLNHINLAVPNVLELTRFFELGFGFRAEDARGSKLTVLRNEDRFLLVIMHDKNAKPGSYPAIFHVGFSVDSVEQVQRHYTLLTDAGFDAPEPAKIVRGGPPTFGFYCNAPGGVVVEVSTMSLAA